MTKRFIVTKVPARDFAKECRKNGWDDGGHTPVNIESVFNFVKYRYEFEGYEIYDGHCPYRIDASEEEIDRKIPEKDYVKLLWLVFGEFIGEYEPEEVPFMLGGNDD